MYICIYMFINILSVFDCAGILLGIWHTINTSKQTPNIHVLSSELVSTWLTMFSCWASIPNLHLYWISMLRAGGRIIIRRRRSRTQIHRLTHFQSASMWGLRVLTAFLCYILRLCLRRHLARHLANILCAGRRRWLRRRRSWRRQAASCILSLWVFQESQMHVCFNSSFGFVNLYSIPWVFVSKL